MWATSGWNCTPNRPRPADSTAANGALELLAVTSKPGAAASTRSPWLAQTSCRFARPRKSAEPGSLTSTWAGPNSRSSAGSTVPPSSCIIHCMP